MKLTQAFLLALFGISTFLITGCETQVAVDPETGTNQTARYQAGYFFGMIEGKLDDTFRSTIQIMDEMGYFRTGERHLKTAVSIFARKVGDEKISIRIKETAEAGQLEMRIRVGAFGNLAESQTIFARVRSVL